MLLRRTELLRKIFDVVVKEGFDQVQHLDQPLM